MMTRKVKFGFTLIELVIVVSIIAVLSGVSLFALNDSRVAGRDARRKADLEEIAAGLELYKADLNYYPTDSNLTFGNSLASGGNIYIQNVPNDPDATKSYDYTLNPGTCDNSSGNLCTRFCIWAILEDTAVSTPTYCNATNCGTAPSGYNYCVINP